jgi:hypothetical protein
MKDIGATNFILGKEIKKYRANKKLWSWKAQDVTKETHDVI